MNKNPIIPILLLFLISLAMWSCKPDSETCKKCTASNSNGQVVVTQENVCSEIDQSIFLEEYRNYNPFCK